MYFPTKSAFLAHGLEPYAIADPSSPAQLIPEEDIPPLLLEAQLPPMGSNPVAAEETANTIVIAAQDQPQSSEEPNITAITRLSLTTSSPVCPICLDNLTLSPPSVRILACSHAYHEQCLRIWVDRNNTCPVCRRLIYGPACRHASPSPFPGLSDPPHAVHVIDELPSRDERSWESLERPLEQQRWQQQREMTRQGPLQSTRESRPPLYGHPRGNRERDGRSQGRGSGGARSHEGEWSDNLYRRAPSRRGGRRPFQGEHLGYG